MKAFKTIFLGAALIFGLGACNNGDAIENIDTTETKTVKVKLSFDAPKTYAVSDAVTGYQNEEVAIEFSSAILFFTNGDGVIKNKILAPDEVTIANLKVGTDIEVAATATKLYVVANTVDDDLVGEDTTYPAVGEDIDVKLPLLKLTLASQSGDAAVYMYGADENLMDGASVTLKTNVARIEIAKIRTTSSNIANAFKVDAIYINGFYTQAPVQLANNPEEDDYKVIASDATDIVKAFTPSETGSIYKSYENSNGVVFDNTGFTTSTKEVVANSSKTTEVWAYNLFTTTAEKPGKKFPHIIIQLSNVKVGYETARVYYLTIEGVSSDGNSENMDFEASNVYTIDDVLFDETHLGTKPYTNVLAAKVTVAPATWTEVQVKPNL